MAIPIPHLIIQEFRSILQAQEKEINVERVNGHRLTGLPILCKMEESTQIPNKKAQVSLLNSLLAAIILSSA